VLVIDATASMQHVIDRIKERTKVLVGRIQSLVPIARVGVVAFRDRGEDFVVRWTDLSFHGSKIESFIHNLRAEGGGDWEEGVRQGIEAAIDELSWRRRAKRVIIVVGSSPPHAEDKEAIAALAAEFRDAGGVISAIDVTRQMHEEYEQKLHQWLYGKPPEKISPLPAFYQEVQASYRAIADDGGGEMAALGSDQELVEQILYFAFGSRWQKEVARYSRED
jgi:Mg-chelatase subunit ChlD